MSREPTSSLSVAGIVRHLRTPLFRNAYALMLSSGVTSVLGLSYWILAARLYSPAAVGVNAAVISSMMFLAGVAQLNLLSALLRFIPEAGRGTVRLIVASYSISIVLGLALGLAFATRIGAWVPGLRALGASPGLTIWFAVATAAWSIFVLEDSVSTGLRRAIWVPISNSIFAVGKIILLVLLLRLSTAYGIFASWTLPVVGTLVITNVVIFGHLVPRHVAEATQHWNRLPWNRLVSYVSADYLGSLCWLACTTLLPVLVTAMAGLRSDAYFYLAWQIGYALHVPSISMGYSLIVEGSSDQQHLAAIARRALVQNLRLVVPIAAVALVAAPYVMAAFGPGYVAGGTPVLRLLIIAALPYTLVSIYISIARVQRRVRQVLLVLAVMGAAVLGLSIVLLPVMGLVGVGWAWLATQTGLAGVLLLTRLIPFFRTLAMADVEPSGRSGLARVGGQHAVLMARRIRAGALQAGSTFEVRQIRRVLLPLIRSDPSLPGAASWVIQRTLSVGPDSATAVFALGPPGSAPPAAVLKVARDRDAAASLDRGRIATLRILGDPRLVGIQRLLPEVLAGGETDGYAFLLQRAMRGVDGRVLLRDPGKAVAVINASLEVATRLHDATARHVTVDAGMIRRWITEPLEAVERLADFHSGIAHNAAAIERLRRLLPVELGGASVVVSTVHGDLFPGNVLLTADGGKVTGLLDWDLSGPDELPTNDIVQFLVGVHLLGGDEELGDVIHGLLVGSAPMRRDLGLLAAAQSRLGGEPVDLRTVVLTFWLRHVSRNLTKSRWFARHRWWVKRNVVDVLATVTALAPEPRLSPTASPDLQNDGRDGDRKSGLSR